MFGFVMFVNVNVCVGGNDKSEFCLETRKTRINNNKMIRNERVMMRFYNPIIKVTQVLLRCSNIDLFSNPHHTFLVNLSILLLLNKAPIKYQNVTINDPNLCILFRSTHSCSMQSSKLPAIIIMQRKKGEGKREIQS